MNEILDILDKDARTTPEQIAIMLGRSTEDVKAAINKMENDKIILGYKPLVNREKIEDDLVCALIELKVTPSAGEGFDSIASRIYCYEQVRNLYLMSGAYDLAVFVEGRNIKEVALFVSEHLAQMDSILSTSTHFMLKTYKREGVIFENIKGDTRELMV
ncbi:MAG: Lrp/AsnC family transcriptional regulator [Bacillota bacterium]|nr:Lrp/AsnC family transcriptional regulator [Bacillota bacterium]